jgi:hypothetical protein
MSNQILKEPESDNTSILYEDSFDVTGKKVKRLKVFGTAIVCDIPGINGRSYPKSILGPEVDRFNEKFVKRGRAAAQLNHPRLTSEGEGKDFSVFEMNLMLTCALVEELYFKGNELYCKMAVVEDHPAGKALAALIRAGYVPGYSLRGAGSVVDTGRGFYEVGDDYRLITIDIVGNPSFDDKALLSSVYESVNSPNKVQLLTESVEMTAKELIYNQNVKTGFKQYDRVALESCLKSYSNLGDL